MIVSLTLVLSALLDWLFARTDTTWRFPIVLSPSGTSFEETDEDEAEEEEVEMKYLRLVRENIRSARCAVLLFTATI